MLVPKLVCDGRAMALTYCFGAVVLTCGSLRQLAHVHGNDMSAYLESDRIRARVRQSQDLRYLSVEGTYRHICKPRPSYLHVRARRNSNTIRTHTLEVQLWGIKLDRHDGDAVVLVNGYG